jgi:hypothetical protein
LGKYPEAVSDFSKCIELFPGDSSASKDRDNSLSHISIYDKDICFVLVANELNFPILTEVNYKRGIVKEIFGDKDGACSDWKKAAELCSSDANA